MGSDPPPRRAEPQDGEQSGYGTLAIRVQPDGANITIDGDAWEGPQGAERLTVQLTEGEHRIEVRKEGFATYATTIQLRGGETRPLNVALSKQ